jgi:two-component system chemotaxis sensor kinase CheA
VATVASDPLRYFRIEARELCDAMARGLTELEQAGPSSEVVLRLLRLAHTLKGAARVVRQLELADLSHRIEELLAAERDGTRPLGATGTRELFGLVDRMSEAVAGLAPAPGAEPAPGRPTPEDAFRTVRVEVEEMEDLLRALTETRVQLSSLRREVATLRGLASSAAVLAGRLGSRRRRPSGPQAEERALAGDLQAGLDRLVQAFEGGFGRVDQELTDVRDSADRVRLVPTLTLHAPLARVARDAAQTLDRSVDFAFDGGAVRLDAHVLGPLRAALSHLVRNAIAHGLENAAERRGLGKPPTGSVRVSVRRQRERVVFACRDDGRGIDVEAVRRGLVARGAVGHAEAASLTRDALFERLLGAQLTTAAVTTQLSGRGVGLDVVRETAARLQGSVTIQSEAALGTNVELSIPMALAAVRALLVESDGERLAIPLDAVQETVRFGPADFRRSERGDSVVREGKVLPFVPLARALRRPAPVDRAAWSAVVLAVGGRGAAIGVDRLRGALDVIVRPLPAGVAADAVIAGAAIDFEGNPELVLDPTALVSLAEDADGLEAATARDTRPLLVIDDSLTTRMLEQSILESAGYRVELAVSAEEGLEKARAARYGLYIVDVEMPGMDGFEFVRLTRADPELAKVPAILVTSRHATEDLERGKSVGASAYIVKGEFDQTFLLARIRELLAGAR